MSSIDQRVVKMVFDNALFEKNVGTTLSTLEKLKNALKFPGAVDGLRDISYNAKNISFDAMAKSIGVVRDGFSALEIVGIRALQRLTDAAIDTGKRIVGALTIEPVKSGFDEYTTQINAIQTILANTQDKLIEQGFNTEHDRIEKVNSVLDELNHYADMTIYNFTEMTRNIGTFTAAGVDLDTAATAIQGIANLAAVSGSNSQQASTAMYQLSQALASGTVKLQDWNSVVNAGMGGKLFQEQLKKTARAHGVAVDDMIAKEGSFRESLRLGWITADVLTETLEKFTAGSEGYTHKQIEQQQALWKSRGYSQAQIESLTGSLHELTKEEEDNTRALWESRGYNAQEIEDIFNLGRMSIDAATKVKTLGQLIDTVKEAMQSGWTQSWEYIVGDFEQAKMLWTEISDIANLYIGKSADARNEILKGWSEATYTYTEDMKLMERQGDKLVEVAEMENDKLGGREAIIQGLRNSFQTLLELSLQLGAAWDLDFLGLGKESNVSNIAMTSEKLIAISHQFLDFTKNMKESLVNKDGTPTELMGEFASAFDFFASSMRRGYDGLAGVFSGLGPMIKAGFTEFINIDAMNSVITALSGFTGIVEDFGDAFRQTFTDSDPDAAAVKYENVRRVFSGLQKIIEAKAWLKLDIIQSGIRAIGHGFSLVISPGEDLNDIIGRIGSKLEIFGNAINGLVNREDVSRIDELFNHLAVSIGGFFAAIRESKQLGAFGTWLNQLTSFMGGSGDQIFDTLFKFLNGIVNIGKTALGILLPLGEALANTFDVRFLFDIVSKFVDLFYDFTNAIRISIPQMDGLRRFFEGIATVAKALIDILSDLIVSGFRSFGDILLAILPNGKSFTDTLGDLGDRLKKVGSNLSDFFNNEDVSIFDEGLGKVTDKIVEFIKSLKDFIHIDKITEGFNNFLSAFKEFMFGTSDISIAEGIADAIAGIFTKLHDAFSENGGMALGDLIGSIGLGTAIGKLFKVFTDYTSSMDVISDIAEKLGEIKDAILDTFESIQSKLKADALMSIGTALLMVAGALLVISMIDSEKLTTAMVSLGVLMTMITLMTKVIASFGNINTGALAGVGAALISISGALLILAVAVRLLGGMEFEALANGMIATMALLSMLTAVAEALGTQNKRIMKGAAALIALAIALDILVIAVKTLGGMSGPELLNGVLATIVLVLTLAGATQLLDNMKFGTGRNLYLMAAAIVVLSKAVDQLGKLDLKSLAKGLGAVAAMLLGLTLAANNMPDNMLSVSTGMLLMAAAIAIMTSAIEKISSIDSNALVVSLIALGFALTELVVAANLMTKALPGAAAMLVMAVAMVPFATALKILASIPFKALMLGLVGLAGALAVMGIASAFLAPMIGPILALAGAMTLFGLGATLFAVSFTLIAVSIATSGAAILLFIKELLLFIPQLGTAFAVMLVNFATSMAAARTELITAVSALFVTLLMQIQSNAIIISQTFVVIIQSLLVALQTLFPQILATFGSFLLQLVAFLLTYAPILYDTGWKLLEGFLRAIADNIGGIVDAGADIIINFLNGLSSRMPEIVNAAINLISTFVTSLVAAVGSQGGSLLSAGGRLVSQALSGIRSKISDMYTAGSNAVQGFINGLLSGAGRVWDAAKNLATNAWNAIKKTLDEHSPSRLTFGGGMNFVLGFANGIIEYTSDAVSAARSVALATLNSFDDAIDDPSFSPTITPVIDSSQVQNGISSIGSMINTIPTSYSIDGINTNQKMASSIDLMDSSLRNEIQALSESVARLEATSADSIAAAVTQSLLAAGIYVRMDSGELMGYLAGQIQDTRRMYS